MAKQRTSLTFYGGVKEIGGNKILLDDRGTRIFLDFGMSFAGQHKFFSGFLTPRGVNGAGDYLEFDLLPRLTGLYARDMIRNTPIKYLHPSSIKNIVLSHPHMDHVGYLTFVDEAIKVHCGECTKTIIDAMQESGRINLGEHKFQTFRTGKNVKIDTLEIEPVHVDHSVPGAYGFIVHTSEGSMVYTGDFRLHGQMGQMTHEFVEKAARCDPVVMISEGTRVGREERSTIYSERMVKAQSSKVVANVSKLVVVSFYSRDIDRFRTFYEVAKNSNRRFVISLKLGHLLWKLKDDPRLKIPNIMKDDHILFYKKRKRTGEFDESDYYRWERPFLNKAVDFRYIHQNQSSVLFNLDLVDFTELIDIRPSAGGHFVHSMSEPFSEEDIDARLMRRWLDHFGLIFHQIHASGHCPPEDLAKVINKVQPKTLIPIHTEHPKLFKRLFKRLKVRIIKKGRQYLL